MSDNLPDLIRFLLSVHCNIFEIKIEIRDNSQCAVAYLNSSGIEPAKDVLKYIPATCSVELKSFDCYVDKGEP